MTFKFSFGFLAGPSSSPSNVRAYSTSSTSIFVYWGKVPAAYQNGVILSYTVKYRVLFSGFLQTVTVAAKTTQTTLTGLNEGTIYVIAVYASTIKGSGPSASRRVDTGNNSELPISFRFHWKTITTTTTTTRKKANTDNANARPNGHDIT